MPLRRLIGIEGEIGARGYSRGRWFAIYMESGWIPRGGTMGRSTIWTRVPRLATTLRGKAIMLYLNIITGAPDHPAVGTIRCAAEWPGTWTERVEALIAALGIDADAWGHLIGEAGEERFTVGAAGVRAREAHKRKLRKIRDELVRPALRATDDAWIEEESKVDPAHAAMWSEATCPAAAAYPGNPTREFWAWTKLRVLAKWPGGCPVCGDADGGWRHITWTHTPGVENEEEALAMMSVPAAGPQFAEIVRYRANVVGSTILGSGKVAPGLGRCERCAASVQLAEAPGGLCHGCVEDVTEQILEEMLRCAAE